MEEDYLATIALEDWISHDVTTTKANDQVLDASPPDNSIDASPGDAQEKEFTRLIPLNSDACIAFDEIARKTEDPSWNPHARRFMHIIRGQPRAVAVHPPEFSSPLGADDYLDAYEYSGYYSLNLAILPRTFVRGWVLGSGPDEVDLLVTLDGRRDQVRGRHTRFYHHSVSAVLMLEALRGKSVIVNSDKLSGSAQTVSIKQGITIGKLTYRLEFLKQNGQIYRNALSILMREQGSLISSSWYSSFDPTPSDKHFALKGFDFGIPEAYGSFGVVSPCIRKSSGEVFAVKRIKRTFRNLDAVKNELTIMKQIPEHPHVCGLLETMFSSGDENSLGDKAISDVHLIMPWAPTTLSSWLTEETRSENLRLAVYHQGAQGLRHIHDQGVIHRDIKSGNIVLRVSNRLQVLIADFGSALQLKSANTMDLRNHYAGTIIYHAPEIRALKQKARDKEKEKEKEEDIWTQSCDVFSYGVVGLEMFFNIKAEDVVQWNEAAHGDGIFNCEGEIGTLLRKMVSWKSMNRITMKEALLRSLWRSRETLLKRGLN